MSIRFLSETFVVVPISLWSMRVCLPVDDSASLTMLLNKSSRRSALAGPLFTSAVVARHLVLKDYLPADVLAAAPSEYKYDLVANIVHDGLPGAGKGTYHAHALHKVCSVCILRAVHVWLHWLLGCVVAWMWLRGCVVAWMYGCLEV